MIPRSIDVRIVPMCKSMAIDTETDAPDVSRWIEMPIDNLLTEIFSRLKRDRGDINSTTCIGHDLREPDRIMVDIEGTRRTT